MPDSRKAQGQRLKTARVAAGYRSAAEAAIANGWNDGTYRTHEAGTRTIGLDDAEKYARRFRARGVDISAQEILFEDGGGEKNPRQECTLAIMGRVGAGAFIDAHFEQAPPEGFEQVELPYPIANDLIGFRIKGDSMAPAYEQDAIIVVEREPTYTAEALIGNAAVVIVKGKNGECFRYLKRIRRGQKRGMFDLESINDRTPTIHDSEIVWVSPVRMIIPNVGLRWNPRKSLKAKVPTGGGKRR